MLERCDVPQRPMAQHWMELGDSYGRVGGRIMGPKGDGNSKGRPTESTNLDLWCLSKTEHQPKNIHRMDLAPLPLCVKMYSSVFMWLLNYWNRAIPRAVVCLWNLSPYLGWLVWPQWEKCVALQGLIDIQVRGLGGPILSEKGKGVVERDCGRRNRKG